MIRIYDTDRTSLVTDFVAFPTDVYMDYTIEFKDLINERQVLAYRLTRQKGGVHDTFDCVRLRCLYQQCACTRQRKKMPSLYSLAAAATLRCLTDNLQIDQLPIPCEVQETLYDRYACCLNAHCCMRCLRHCSDAQTRAVAIKYHLLCTTYAANGLDVSGLDARDDANTVYAYRMMECIPFLYCSRNCFLSQLPKDFETKMQEIVRVQKERVRTCGERIRDELGPTWTGELIDQNPSGRYSILSGIHRFQ